jgi:signal transduction histidine kinase
VRDLLKREPSCARQQIGRRLILARLGHCSLPGVVEDQLPLELTMPSEMITLRNELRRKDEFIATLGHELRNPLSVLTTASLIFKMDGATSTDMKRAADIIGRQVQLVTRLINDLLDIERIDNGKLQLDLRSVDLREIVTNSLQSRRADAERRKQSLTMALTQNPVVVNADAVRLGQVVSNLVDNAVKYTPEEGHINVAVTADGHEAVIVVQDDGAGIPAERVDSIFEPFVQLSQSRKAARGGMGLGLALVRRLTELHGGTVDVTSSGQDHGSRFAVHLPLQQPIGVSLVAADHRTIRTGTGLPSKAPCATLPRSNRLSSDAPVAPTISKSAPA